MWISGKHFVQLCLTIISIISAYLVSLLPINGTFLFLLIILLALSIITWFFNIIVTSVQRYDFKYRIEGMWVQSHFHNNTSNQTYCLVEIEVNEITGVSLKGMVYDESGKFIAQWEGKDVGVNNNERILIYIYDGTYPTCQIEGNGYGKIQFFRSTKKIITDGKGFFQDSISKHMPVNYMIERIDAELCNKLIEKKSPKGPKDCRKFIQEYHEYIKNI